MCSSNKGNFDYDFLGADAVPGPTKSPTLLRIKKWRHVVLTPTFFFLLFFFFFLCHTVALLLHLDGAYHI